MIGEIIGGLGSLVGGLFGKSSAKKANEQNIQLQKDFAQKGIQWKVKDAIKAGIHPLAALGANTISFTPSTVGDGGLAEGIAGMGQGIGRAIDAGRTQGQRDGSLQATIAHETLKGLRLDNEGKAIQNAALASETVRRSQVGPAIPAMASSPAGGLSGQASSKLRIGASGSLPSFPGSTASDLGNSFGELIEDFAGAVNFRDSMAKMSPNQKAALFQAVFPGIPLAALRFPRPNRIPVKDYGPPVTTKSFRDTFQ